MSGDFGNDFITITDDDGNEFELEHLDTAEMNGQLYMAFLPTDVDENDEEFGMVILKMLVEDDEEIFETVEDDDELDEVFAMFIERLSEKEE